MTAACRLTRGKHFASTSNCERSLHNATSTDFDPATDRLRVSNVVSPLGDRISYNLVVNVDTCETVEELLLRFAPGDVIEGRQTGFGNIAYSNNYAGATSAALYSVGGSILRLNLADGTVARVAPLSGTLFNSGPYGFDISGVTGTAYFVTNSGGTRPNSTLYSVDLNTGEAKRLGETGMYRRIGWFSLAAPVGLPRRPFSGTPRLVPGRIEAEDYDEGGQNAAYYDSTVGNEGAVYRSDDVDLKETSDEAGGYAVGWLAAGEWLSYTVEVAEAGTYDLEIRARLSVAGQNVPHRGGWAGRGRSSGGAADGGVGLLRDGAGERRGTYGWATKIASSDE